MIGPHTYERGLWWACDVPYFSVSGSSVHGPWSVTPNMAILASMLPIFGYKESLLTQKALFTVAIL